MKGNKEKEDKEAQRALRTRRLAMLLGEISNRFNAVPVLGGQRELDNIAKDIANLTRLSDDSNIEAKVKELFFNTKNMEGVVNAFVAMIKVL